MEEMGGGLNFSQYSINGNLNERVLKNYLKVLKLGIFENLSKETFL